MGVTGVLRRTGRTAARAAITFVVVAATVLTPLGGLAPAAAALTDLPDRTWGVVGRDRSITSLIPSEVMAIEQVGNTIYAGGQFKEVVRRRAVDPHHSQPFLAAFDATSGEFIDWWRPEFNGPIFALEASADGKRLYVGGEFTEVNGHPGTAGVVALDPASGRVDHTWTPTVENAFSDDPGVVNTIVESGGFLYIGGNFSHVTGNNPSSRRNVSKVARLSLSTGAIDTTWRPQVVGGSVRGMDHDPVRGRVYLAGYFDSVNAATPSDRFAVVSDADGSTITGFNRFPELTPNQDHQFAVIAHGDYVWVAGTQHLVHMLNASDLSIHRRWFTGYVDGYHIGGDYQALAISGNIMYASCHCFGVIRELPEWVTTLAQARQVEPVVDEVQGITGFDLTTGDYVTGWAPDIFGSIGGWALLGAGDGCLWAGGDLNRRSVGDTWRNGIVRWCDADGQGPPVAPPLVEQPPPETKRPSPPATLSAADRGDGSVDLDWGASTDDTAVVYYRVYRNGTLLRATRSRSLIDLGATPGDSYTVRAVDPYGNESTNSPRATPNLRGLPEPVLAAAFDGNDESFVYRDDAFGTSLPGYADPLLRRDGGVPDGNLMVILGGVDGATLGPFSGAWERTFTMPSAGAAELSLMYKLRVKDSLENGEYGEARAAIDGTQLNGGFLEHIAGGGETGWVNYTTTVYLTAGDHVLSLGGYQNSKSNYNEFVEVSFDDVSLTPIRPTVGFTSPDPGDTVAEATEFELRASSLLFPSSSLTVHVSTNGGARWSPATWNAVKQRFEFSHDFSAAPDGPFTLQARVRDGAGRTGFSSATYRVDNDDDPTITITSPSPGSDVTKTVTVRLDAADTEDPLGSLNVDVSTDGATWHDATWNGREYTYRWDTRVVTPGPATVRARVRDSKSHLIHAAPVPVTVKADYRTLVLGDGAVAFWRLNDGGRRAADATGQGHKAVFRGPTTRTAPLIGEGGRSATFDGVDDLIAVRDHVDLNTAASYQARSIELWFESNSAPRRQVLWEEGGAGHGIVIYVDNGKLQAGAWNRNELSGWARDVFVRVPFTPGETYHVVLTVRAGNRIKLFVDGEKVAAATGVGAIESHGGNIGIGARNGSTRFRDTARSGGPGNFLDGVIDEVAVYNTALTRTQIVAHFEAAQD